MEDSILSPAVAESRKLMVPARPHRRLIRSKMQAEAGPLGRHSTPQTAIHHRPPKKAEVPNH